MALRTKILLVFVALGVLPLFAVSVLSYVSGVGAVEGLLSERAEGRASRMALRAAYALETQKGSADATAAGGLWPPQGEGHTVSGAPAVELRLKELLKAADEPEGAVPSVSEAPAEASPAEGERSHVVALDNATGRIIYHTKAAYCHHHVSKVMPYFAGVAERMQGGESGRAFYEAPDGSRWLAAFRQVRGAGLSLAAAENYTAATYGVRRSGLLGVGLALASGGAALLVALLIVGRVTRGIGRVANGAAAIASGNLEQRIEVESADAETRRLAESFNLMSDRLRKLIERERELVAADAERRQFDSFLRISAMVTHDLKNAISGITMLVANMEKYFDREEFRADAIGSLRDATEKLGRTVARLSEPAKSLSGEYRRDSRPTDLVPIIRRVLAERAEPARPLYEIEARLPDRLVATVEAGRIENVVENLVINALEAMGAAGGRLMVEAGQQGPDLIFISVADTGVGMSEEFIRTKLFRPFSTTKAQGIGLGLFTCREVVEAHGGRLDVESKVGVGTRFRVVIPSSLFKPGDRGKRPAKGAASEGPGGPDA